MSKTTCDYVDVRVKKIKTENDKIAQWKTNLQKWKNYHHKFSDALKVAFEYKQIEDEVTDDNKREYNELQNLFPDDVKLIAWEKMVYIRSVATGKYLYTYLDIEGFQVIGEFAPKRRRNEEKPLGTCWKFESTGDGSTFYIKSISANLYLRKSDYNDMISERVNDSNEFKWKISKTLRGRYEISNLFSRNWIQMSAPNKISLFNRNECYIEPYTSI